MIVPRIIGDLPIARLLNRLPGDVTFATMLALNATAKDVQTFALNTALPGAFTLRSRGQPWQKPGGKFGFNVRPRATKSDLTAVIGSQADWLRLQEQGGVKSGAGHRLAIEAGARPSRTSVLPAALKPRRILGRKKGGGFTVNVGGGASLVLTRKGKETKLMYVLKPKANVKARLAFESRGGTLGALKFGGHFTAAFTRAVAISTNAALR